MPEHLPYRVGVGHDLALIDTDIMLQQPTAGLVAPVERHYGINGTIYDEGGFVRFVFEMIESDTLYQQLLGQFGLNDNFDSPVTIYARNDRMYWRHYNGIAHRPEPNVDAKWENFFLKDVVIYVTDLVEIA
jgi:hypothetical protein